MILLKSKNNRKIYKVVLTNVIKMKKLFELGNDKAVPSLEGVVTDAEVLIKDKYLSYSGSSRSSYPYTVISTSHDHKFREPTLILHLEGYDQSFCINAVSTRVDIGTKVVLYATQGFKEKTVYVDGISLLGNDGEELFRILSNPGTYFK